MPCPHLPWVSGFLVPWARRAASRSPGSHAQTGTTLLPFPMQRKSLLAYHDKQKIIITHLMYNYTFVSNHSNCKHLNIRCNCWTKNCNILCFNPTTMKLTWLIFLSGKIKRKIFIFIGLSIDCPPWSILLTFGLQSTGRNVKPFLPVNYLGCPLMPMTSSKLSWYSVLHYTTVFNSGLSQLPYCVSDQHDSDSRAGSKSNYRSILMQLQYGVIFRKLLQRNLYSQLVKKNIF